MHILAAHRGGVHTSPVIFVVDVVLVVSIGIKVYLDKRR
jgi:hypothetical protein